MIILKKHEITIVLVYQVYLYIIKKKHSGEIILIIIVNLYLTIMVTSGKGILYLEPFCNLWFWGNYCDSHI